MRGIGTIKLVPAAALLLLPLLACAAEGKKAGKKDAAAGAKVRVAGIRVVSEGVGKNKTELRPFNYNKGTTLALLVRLPAGGLIKFNRGASKLSAMTDDKGSDFTRKPKKTGRFSFGSRTGFEMAFNAISKDGGAALVQIGSPNLPAKGATRVSVSGTLVFQRASRKQTFKQTGVALKAGTKIQAGKIPFTITKAGKPQWGNAAASVTLRTTQAGPELAGIRFLDAAGKEIKSSRQSWSRGGKMSSSTYTLARKVDKVTVVMDYWTDLQTITIPFNLKTGLGLQ